MAKALGQPCTALCASEPIADKYKLDLQPSPSMVHHQCNMKTLAKFLVSIGQAPCNGTQAGTHQSSVYDMLLREVAILLRDVPMLPRESFREACIWNLLCSFSFCHVMFRET